MLAIISTRGGTRTQYLWQQIEQCVLDQQISAADSVEITLAETCLAADDLVELVEYGTLVGRFVVTSAEAVQQNNGEIRYKATAKPLACERLDFTPIPGTTYLKDIGLLTGLDLINRAESLTYGAQTVFVGYTAPSELVDSLTFSSPDSALAALDDICRTTGVRWRSRPDIEGQYIDYGKFGDQKQTEITTADGGAGHGDPDIEIFVASEATMRRSADDAVNKVYPFGGSWQTGSSSDPNVDAEQFTQYLTIEKAGAPSGYTKITEEWPDGKKYYALKKDTDKNGNTFGRVRARKISISGVVASAANGGVPDDASITKAATALMKAAIEYLEQQSEYKETWKVAVPYSTLRHFLVGDKVYVNLHDPRCDASFSGSLYVSSRRVMWRDGEVTADIELSNVLESLRDPLSAEFDSAKVNAKGDNKTQQGGSSYSVAITTDGTTGLGTYVLPAGYTAVPTVSLGTPPGGCTWTLVSVSTTTISVSVSPAGGLCQTVIALIKPAAA